MHNCDKVQLMIQQINAAKSRWMAAPASVQLKISTRATNPLFSQSVVGNSVRSQEKWVSENSLGPAAQFRGIVARIYAVLRYHRVRSKERMKGKGGFFGPPEAGAEVRADQNFRLLCPQRPQLWSSPFCRCSIPHSALSRSCSRTRPRNNTRSVSI